MIRIDIDSSALVRFMQNIQKVPRLIEHAAVKALNRMGQTMVEEVVEAAAAQTGLDSEAIRRYVTVERAAIGNPTFRIDASEALIEAPATRPMVGRRRFARRPEGYFNAQELVKIVTMGDELVCPICQGLEEEGPYSIEDARTLIPAHPNCRCVVQTFRSRRELPVAFRRGQQVEVASVTMQQLLDAVRTEVDIVLTALKEL